MVSRDRWVSRRSKTAWCRWQRCWSWSRTTQNKDEHRRCPHAQAVRQRKIIHVQLSLFTRHLHQRPRFGTFTRSNRGIPCRSIECRLIHIRESCGLPAKNNAYEWFSAAFGDPQCSNSRPECRGLHAQKFRRAPGTIDTTLGNR